VLKANQLIIRLTLDFARDANSAYAMASMLGLTHVHIILCRRRPT